MTRVLPNQQPEVGQLSKIEGAAIVWQPRQKHLHEWFLNEAPTLAEPYKAAVSLMNDTMYPARVHLVCHIVRDIYTFLPEILSGGRSRMHGGSVYPGLLDRLGKIWKIHATPAVPTAGPCQGSPGPSSDFVEVSLVAIREVEGLLHKHQEIKDQPSSAEVLARALYERYVEAEASPPVRLINEFSTARKWFTERAHLVIAVEKIRTDDGLANHFEAFERSLASLVSPHFSVQQEIDDILQHANQ